MLEDVMAFVYDITESHELLVCLLFLCRSTAIYYFFSKWSQRMCSFTTYFPFPSLASQLLWWW